MSNAIEFASRKKQLTRLMDNGTFIPVYKREITPSTLIFGSRFIESLKKDAQGTQDKSRLEAQNYANDGARQRSRKELTGQRFSQRLLLSLTGSLPNMTTFSRDINKAYIQNNSTLERDIYITLPPQLRLRRETVFKILRPICEIPQSGFHWNISYLVHLENNRSTTRATVDPSVLVKRSPHQS